MFDYGANKNQAEEKKNWACDRYSNIVVRCSPFLCKSILHFVCEMLNFFSFWFSFFSSRPATNSHCILVPQINMWFDAFQPLQAGVWLKYLFRSKTIIHMVFRNSIARVCIWMHFDIETFRPYHIIFFFFDSFSFSFPIYVHSFGLRKRIEMTTTTYPYLFIGTTFRNTYNHLTNNTWKLHQLKLQMVESCSYENLYTMITVSHHRRPPLNFCFSRNSPIFRQIRHWSNEHRIFSAEKRKTQSIHV